MILFKTIRWCNFLSTGNVFTEISLNSHNTTLIVGDNGAGKSTLLDALSFVLFGKAFRNINKPQLINSITQKGLLVEVEFSIGSNEFKIVRGIKPNVFEVFQNGSLMNQSAEMKDYQEILEKQILKVNHKSFCQVVILGSATFQPFMQLSAANRRDIIEDLLDLKIFTTMNTLLKDKMSVNKESINQRIAEKNLIEEKIELIKIHLKEMQNNNESLILDRKNRIEEIDSSVINFNNELNKLEEKHNNLLSSVEDESSISKKINDLSSLRHKIEANLSILKKDIGFFKKYDDCPTCKQPINSEFKCETIESKEAEMLKINEGLEKLSKQYDKANKKLSKIMEINSDISTCKMEIYRIKTKINSLNSQKENIENEIKSLSKRVIVEDDNKIIDLQNQLNNNMIAYNELVDEKNILTTTSSMLKDGGIKAKIIKQYIPIINKLINKYLSSMEFMCQFELNEEFKETIKSRYRDEFSYESFSEGEKMRINLAILFTWRAIAKLRNSINTNILIMDEVFDSSLDSNGTEEFFRLIKDLTNDTNTFIISHKTDQLYDKFEKTIKFVKHKNFSKVA